MQDSQRETKVPGDGGLPGEERFDAALEAEIQVVHFVVESDHLVRELGVVLAQ